MDEIRQQAMICVGRAVGFGFLAICMVMLGFIFDLVLFFRSGALLAVLQSLILLWYAQTALDRAPENTETWLCLDQASRPNNPHTNRFFQERMKDTYGYFGRWSIRISLTLLGASIILAVFGVRFILPV